MNRKKDVGKKPDTAVIVAIIALVGTLITAVLTSPVLIAIISKTPSPILTDAPLATSQALTPVIQTSTLLVPLTSVPQSSDGKIAFISNKGNVLGIYLLNIKDKSIIPLPASLTGSGRFKWSPDGKKILYSNSETGLSIIDIENFQSSLLTDNTLIFAFNWSPTNSQVVFGNGKGIYFIDTNSKDYQLLASLVLEVSGMTDAVAWSPDNSEIALSAWDNAGDTLNLYLINPNGSNLRNLNSLNQWARNDGRTTYNLAWSPNSKYLATMTESAILLIGRDGISKTIYSKEYGFDTFQNSLSWSPDSTKIIFDDVNSVIRVINITDETITVMPLNGTCPSWSPDGKSIILVAPGLNGNEIYLTNDNGTEKLTDNMQVQCAKWQP